MHSDRGLAVAIGHRLGTLRLAVAFRSAAPWTLLFGPSGSGKSTVLHAIAGLLRPAEGRIVLDGVTVFDAETGVDLPATRRSLRWAGQRTALFPHMTVQENLAFGLADLSPYRRRATLEAALDAFALRPLAAARPSELSGGQRQRVAVVRAAAGARGRLLLLDEPFTGLDNATRAELIAALRAWLGATPVVSVTHDVGEAFLLGAEVVRLAAGGVLAQGSASAVLAGERTALEGVLRVP